MADFFLDDKFDDDKFDNDDDDLHARMHHHHNFLLLLLYTSYTIQKNENGKIFYLNINNTIHYVI